jgi:hypothetical protein
MQSAIEAWTEEHKKPPGYKDIIETIGPQVIKQRSGEHWWSANRSFFDQDVPVQFSDTIKADAQARGEDAPTDEEVSRAYVRGLFSNLYHKKDTTSGGPVKP